MKLVNRYKSLLTASLLGFIVLCSYLSTLIKIHTPDAISYALSIQAGNWPTLLHPNHLLFSPLARGNYLFWCSIGRCMDPLKSTQILNAIVAALGVVVLFQLLRELTESIWISITAALSLAVSAAYWQYAVEVEVYIIPVVGLLICLWVAIHHLTRPQKFSAVVMGMLLGFSSLFLQSSILGLGICILGVLLSHSQLQRKLLHIVAAGLVVIVILTIGYLVLPCLAISRCSLLSLWESSLTYAKLPWFGRWNSSTWYKALLGFGNAVAGGIHMPQAVTNFIVNTFGHGSYAVRLLPFAIVGGILIIVTLNGPGIYRHWQGPVLLATSWLVPFAIFATWWDPSNVEFWIPCLPPLFLLFGLSLRNWWQRLREPKRLASMALAALFILSIGASTLIYCIYPKLNPNNSLEMRMVHALAPLVSEHDLVIVPKDWWAFPSYFQFYANCRAITLHYLAERYFFYEQGQEVPSFADAIHNMLKLTWESGGQVYVVDNGFQIPYWVINRQLMSLEAVAVLEESFKLEPIANLGQEHILYRLSESP